MHNFLMCVASTVAGLNCRLLQGEETEDEYLAIVLEALREAKTAQVCILTPGGKGMIQKYQPFY